MRPSFVSYALLLSALFLGLLAFEQRREQEEVLVTIGGPERSGENIYGAYRDRIRKTGERQRRPAAAAE